MDKIIGGQLAAEALIDRDVEYIFSLSGGHITPIYQFLENSKVTIFDTRHEQAAVFMAEAWARMTRKPAVAMVTAGPGFTNALSGIASARLSNAPGHSYLRLRRPGERRKARPAGHDPAPGDRTDGQKGFCLPGRRAHPRIHRHGFPSGHERPARSRLPGASLRHPERPGRYGQGQEDAYDG